MRLVPLVASSSWGRTQRRALHVEPLDIRPLRPCLGCIQPLVLLSEPLLWNHAIMLFRLRRNRAKLVERKPEMLGKLCQRSGQYPTGVVDGMARDDTKGDRDQLLCSGKEIEVAPLTNSLGAGGQVADHDVEAELVGQLLQFAFQQPHPRAIAAAAPGPSPGQA